MDKIYLPERFNSSEKINLNDEFKALAHFKLYPSKVNTDKLRNKEYHEVLCKELNISDPNEQRRLREVTHEKLLTAEDEECSPRTLSKRKRGHVTDNSTTLATVKARQMFKSQITEIYAKHKHHLDTYECVKAGNAQRQVDSPSATICALSIRIYQPFNFSYPSRLEARNGQGNVYSNLRFSQEILVLPSNTLAELRDCIKCHADEGLSLELKEEESEHTVGNSKAEYPSGFFFVENVFYNDLRRPNSFDYSEVIRGWGTDRGIKMDVGSMDLTRIGDLSVRFGYPYVYQHQGRCEHIFTFGDGWVLNTRDNLDTDKYPLCVSIHTPYSRLCSVCGVDGSQWVCVDSDRMPLNPMLLCESCFKCYNFVDGKRVGSFKAYPFVDKKVLV
ncbi:hypothetical protein PPYR_02747 [Photinus pyralis]|uniref:snRNA-activating protein complex subunit 3 n=1 Tax=Photinus pyralis TaxID=7054 RepID=A0A1Y1M1G9_PHOPY|nr:snRNA-activating protein complex subunit 3 [Photinus pyralis]KAB0790947.1 hypothetical protein PPYR_02747 [Photinus pyralis]